MSSTIFFLLSPYRHIILPNGVLQIHNVSFEDEGQYKCVAANPVQVVRSVLATLTVLPQDLNLVPLSEPTFIHRPAPQRVVAGDDVLLECLVEGAPLIISWSRKGMFEFLKFKKK